jgi:hypothetical protein
VRLLGKDSNLDYLMQSYRLLVTNALSGTPEQPNDDGAEDSGLSRDRSAGIPILIGRGFLVFVVWLLATLIF